MTSTQPLPNFRVTEIMAFVPAKDFERSKTFYRDIGFTMA
jgi:predicted lactoylglutathione lyase